MEKNPQAGLWARFPIIGQFFRFVVIGTANTLLDWGIIYVLTNLIFQIYAGWPILVFNTISFFIASTNSFFWNRYWTFKYQGGNGQGFQYLQFIIVTAIGLAINSGIVYVMTTLVGPRFGVPANWWVIVGKAVATAVSLFWNFIGYKFFVFQKQEKGKQ